MKREDHEDQEGIFRTITATRAFEGHVKGLQASFFFVVFVVFVFQPL